TDIDLGWVENQASVEGLAPDGTIVDDLSGTNPQNDEITYTTICQRNGISLQKTGTFNDSNNDGYARVGETVNYFFSLINTGNTTLEQVELVDPLLGGTMYEWDELPAGTTVTWQETYTITADDIEAGMVTNQATVHAISPNGMLWEDLSDDPTDPTDMDVDGDGDPDDPTDVEIIGETGSEIEIFNGITPNGDGSNDYFEIRGISNFPKNHVSIFNRWGVLVWETTGYNESQNVFRGYSNGRATINRSDKLPSGTYFYTIRLQNPQSSEKERSYSGFLYINP
ncbi:gliding motility-associated C-terminal domain-containing protein, partial [Paraglaciecola sp.]|uniref:T9SS type B sorting domain-containing protein n=1 Tax=Paraglaciecola sp. TaxID=1920173 RepID=UPI003EF6B264